MSSLNITVLVDNTVHTKGLLSEHGLSLAITRSDGTTWLLDTGASGLFLDNAAALGIDLGNLQGVILSHGHYDHTGGLFALHSSTGFCGPVYGHPHVLLERYKPADDGAKPIGMPDPCRQSVRDRIIPLTGVWQLAPGMTFLSAIPRQTNHFQATQGFFHDSQATEPDLILDDAVLVLDTASGPVLLTGCSHSGLANILAACRSELGLPRIHTLIGGLHLHDAPDEAVAESITALEAADVKAVYAGHCTGQKPLAILRERLGERIKPLGAGLRLSFPAA